MFRHDYLAPMQALQHYITSYIDVLFSCATCTAPHRTVQLQKYVKVQQTDRLRQRQITRNKEKSRNSCRDGGERERQKDRRRRRQITKDIEKNSHRYRGERQTDCHSPL